MSSNINQYSNSLSQTSVTFFSKEIERPYHEHCPLCIDSMVYSKGDNRPPAFIFVDMDGVFMGDQMMGLLSRQIDSTVSALFPQVREYTEFQWTVAKAKHLDPQALHSLHSLIERTEASGRRALVVLSSSWRNDATLQQHRVEVFAHLQFSKNLCGKTPPEDAERRFTPECKQGFRFTEGAKESFGLKLKNRADTIEFWLRDHGFDPESTNFVVLDDDRFCGLKRFGERFILIRENLFREEHLEQAASALKL